MVLFVHISSNRDGPCSWGAGKDLDGVFVFVEGPEEDFVGFFVLVEERLEEGLDGLGVVVEGPREALDLFAGVLWSVVIVRT